LSQKYWVKYKDVLIWVQPFIFKIFLFNLWLKKSLHRGSRNKKIVNTGCRILDSSKYPSTFI